MFLGLDSRPPCTICLVRIDQALRSAGTLPISDHCPRSAPHKSSPCGRRSRRAPRSNRRRLGNRRARRRVDPHRCCTRRDGRARTCRSLLPHHPGELHNNTDRGCDRSRLPIRIRRSRCRRATRHRPHLRSRPRRLRLPRPRSAARRLQHLHLHRPARRRLRHRTRPLRSPSQGRQERQPRTDDEVIRSSRSHVKLSDPRT